MDTIFFDITVILCVATILSYVFRLLHQPAIVAYILTGILLGPLGLFHLGSTGALMTFGNVGITLLLFMLGLELQVKELVSIGKTAGLIAILQVWFTFFVGFITAKLLGYSVETSFFVGVTISISSTVILVKLFSEKKDLNSLHAKLALGISLVQDLGAVLLLIFLAQPHLFSNPAAFSGQILILLLKVILVFAVIACLSYKVFPLVTRYMSGSDELMFLFSLSWMFVLSAIVVSPFIGFSMAIGGFLAGLALANTNEHFQIVGRMKPLRDFFLTIFFVTLGLQMNFSHFWLLLPQVFVIIILAIGIKPLIILFLTSSFGFRKRTSFLVSLSLGQISEFSLLLVFLARQRHYLSSDMVSVLMLAGLSSFAISTYLVQSSTWLYKLVGGKLDWIERAHTSSHEEMVSIDLLTKMHQHVVIVGGHQMGMSILRSLEKDEDVVVVDFDPEAIKRLKEHSITYLFGDIADPEIQERAQLDKAKLVISTVPDADDNLSLIEHMNKANRRAKIVVMAYEADDAKRLYKAGADYVVLPHLAGGRHIAKILKEELIDIEKYKKKDLEALA